MARTTIFLTTILALVASFLAGCDKAPSGVIPESDMVHVLADFAKAEALIEQNPGMYPDDSSKLALKQSILLKYDADLAMYDSSLVWYAHNLKLYSELHDKAVALLEKEGNIKPNGNAVMPRNLPLDGGPGMAQQGGATARRVYPNSGDSANIWTEPVQWVLTSAMGKGYITYDYMPDNESRRGDAYSLNLKSINNSGNTINVMMALDYSDGTTSYVNRTVNIAGWSNFDIQSDSSRNVTRIYGYLHYDIKPQRVSFIDSIYLLRTHLDRSSYHRIGIQRIAGPKDVLKKDSVQRAVDTKPVDISPKFPGRPAGDEPVRDLQQPNQPTKLPPAIERRRNEDGSFRPKPGLNKPVIPSRERIPNPNGDHVPRPPIR